MNEKTTVAQIDIFGKHHSSDIKPAETVKKTSTKFYPKVNLSSGLNDTEITNDFVFIHRILQRKLNTDIQKNITKLIQVVYNEMAIKAGRADAITATRNSLMMCFIDI